MSKLVGKLHIGKRSALLLAVCALLWGIYLGYLVSERTETYTLGLASIILENHGVSPELYEKYGAALHYLEGSDIDSAARNVNSNAEEIHTLAGQIRLRVVAKNAWLVARGAVYWIVGIFIVYVLMLFFGKFLPSQIKSKASQ